MDRARADGLSLGAVDLATRDGDFVARDERSDVRGVRHVALRAAAGQSCHLPERRSCRFLPASGRPVPPSAPPRAAGQRRCGSDRPPAHCGPVAGTGA